MRNAHFGYSVAKPAELYFMGAGIFIFDCKKKKGGGVPAQLRENAQNQHRASSLIQRFYLEWVWSGRSLTQRSLFKRKEAEM